jgi:DNA-binding cell septation regulator SpoVG
MIIARYNSVVCEVRSIKLDASHRLKFISFFEGTDEMFIAKYKPVYPNHTFQIFRHVRKPLSKNVRTIIENAPEIKAKLRDYNLSKLLD